LKSVTFAAPVHERESSQTRSSCDSGFTKVLAPIFCATLAPLDDWTSTGGEPKKPCDLKAGHVMRDHVTLDCEQGIEAQVPPDEVAVFLVNLPIGDCGRPGKLAAFVAVPVSLVILPGENNAELHDDSPASAGAMRPTDPPDASAHTRRCCLRGSDSCQRPQLTGMTILAIETPTPAAVRRGCLLAAGQA
jgi:hypothetical protein